MSFAAPLLPEHEDALLELANRSAAETVERVRKTLGLIALSGAERNSLVGRFGAQLAGEWLVHTVYSEDRYIRRMLIDHVKQCRREDAPTERLLQQLRQHTGFLCLEIALKSRHVSFCWSWQLSLGLLLQLCLAPL